MKGKKKVLLLLGGIVFNDLIITKIYSDCFLAEDSVNFQEKIKMNGTLPEEWCEGDVVRCGNEVDIYKGIIKNVLDKTKNIAYIKVTHFL